MGGMLNSPSALPVLNLKICEMVRPNHPRERNRSTASFLGCGSVPICLVSDKVDWRLKVLGQAILRGIPVGAEIYLGSRCQTTKQLNTFNLYEKIGNRCTNFNLHPSCEW